VTLTIPDNEAYTALTTLARIGIDVARVQRADVWIATLDDASAAAHVDAVMAATETVYNPNKHRLEIRSDVEPRSGEVWITAGDETPTIHLGGRIVAGMRGIVRRTSWRLLDEHGADVPVAVLERATETFLCNPAFQRALR
jgi:phosphoribosylformylglycinamidine (FGAM) synthase PurS component